MRDSYDVVIIGAGPAGIFSALEVAKSGRADSVLIVEQGADIGERGRDSLTRGWGGSGAYSDGKLILSTAVGGWLADYLPHPELEKLIDYADKVYRDFGGEAERFGAKPAKTLALKKKAEAAGLELVPIVVRHLGTDVCLGVLRRMREVLAETADIVCDTKVDEIIVKDGRAAGVRLAGGKEIAARYVIAAPGRSGAKWLAAEARRLGLSTSSNQVDLGVRVETPASVMEPLTKDLYEAKLLHTSKRFNDRIRTFCVNPYGEVTKERYHDSIETVNGHSYAGRKTANTNFALLVSTTFTEPFKEPILYGENIARLANLQGEGIIVQRLGDLLNGRRSTKERIEQGSVVPTLVEATPGDLSFVLPYRYISDILEMLAAMDKIAPGVCSRNTLLYGVEVKFYSQRLRLSEHLETEVGGLFAIGDGAGVTRGLIQASAAGIVAARAIISEDRE
jgi:hypothetical protein